jgi:hypothetical protein
MLALSTARGSMLNQLMPIMLSLSISFYRRESFNTAPYGTCIPTKNIRILKNEKLISTTYKGEQFVVLDGKETS